uniref:Thioredoxin domain-containing protein n=1 Tax=Quercus lobata TaxID=97700 RepID=A0A7N2R2A0_QUELO
MPMKQLDATVSNFDTVFEKFRSEAPNNKANLILFLADKDPSTSLSWCPGSITQYQTCPKASICIGPINCSLIGTPLPHKNGDVDVILHDPQDCVRAEPVIYKKLETGADDVALLRAFVGDRPTWRNPQHPWRVDSRFKLTGVPTLIRWENDTIQGRLEDHEAHLENKIDALVAGK